MPKRQLSTTELLDVASDVVLRHGFAKTAMADIAKAAGVSKGLLYLRFSDKNELLASLLDREFVMAIHATSAAVESDEQGGLLSHIYLHALHGLNARPLLWSFYVDQEASLSRFVRRANPRRYEQRVAAGRRFIDQLFTTGMIRTNLGGSLTDVLALFTFGLAISAPHQRVDPLIEGVAELVAHGLDADVTDTAPGKDAFQQLATELIATTEWTGQ